MPCVDLTFCLKLVTDVSHRSACGLFAAARQETGTFEFFTEKAEQNQAKDHFANIAPRAATGKLHRLYLVCELYMSGTLFFSDPVKTKWNHSEPLLRRGPFHIRFREDNANWEGIKWAATHSVTVKWTKNMILDWEPSTPTNIWGFFLHAISICSWTLILT